MKKHLLLTFFSLVILIAGPAHADPFSHFKPAYAGVTVGSFHLDSGDFSHARRADGSYNNEFNPGVVLGFKTDFNLMNRASLSIVVKNSHDKTSVFALGYHEIGRLGPVTTSLALGLASGYRDKSGSDITLVGGFDFIAWNCINVLVVPARPIVFGFSVIKQF